MSLATAVSQLLLLIVFLSLSEAREFLVGGTTDSWKIPESDPDALDKWAEEFRFRIGDSLVWKYEAGKDSVLQVTKEAYLSCNTTNPIAEYNDGNTTVNLARSGPYYFISGEPGHCEKGQKLTVIVLSTKHLRSAATPVPAPAPAPAGGPAGSPSGEATSLKGLQYAAMGALVGLGYVMI
ncbi:unnamed protein product [Rhodiola kirilowii]